MKFSIKNFFSKCNQIHSFPRIWSHLLNKSLMENFIFCAVLLIFPSQYRLNDKSSVQVDFIDLVYQSGCLSVSLAHFYYIIDWDRKFFGDSSNDLWRERRRG